MRNRDGEWGGYGYYCGLGQGVSERVEQISLSVRKAVRIRQEGWIVLGRGTPPAMFGRV